MPFWISPEGTRYERSGEGRAFCSKCRVVFNSTGAFDAHIFRVRGMGKTRIVLDEPEHDYSRLVQNNSGYYVIGLLPEHLTFSRKENK